MNATNFGRQMDLTNHGCGGAKKNLFNHKDEKAQAGVTWVGLGQRKRQM